MDAGLIDETILTERQVEVVQLREEGRTQQEVADLLGTTPSNISRVEQTAENNIEKARRTLELVRMIRAPVRIEMDAGSSFEDVVDAVYERGDEAGVQVDYCRPELYSHLYTHLEGEIDNNELLSDVEIGLTTDGDVKIAAIPEE